MIWSFTFCRILRVHLGQWLSIAVFGTLVLLKIGIAWTSFNSWTLVCVLSSKSQTLFLATRVRETSRNSSSVRKLARWIRTSSIYKRSFWTLQLVSLGGGRSISCRALPQNRSDIVIVLQCFRWRCPRRILSCARLDNMEAGINSSIYILLLVLSIWRLASL